MKSYSSLYTSALAIRKILIYSEADNVKLSPAMVIQGRAGNSKEEPTASSEEHGVRDCSGLFHQGGGREAYYLQCHLA